MGLKWTRTFVSSSMASLVHLGDKKWLLME